MQTTDTVLMVRPAHFTYNAETALSNYFQQFLAGLDDATVQARAQAEFDAAVATLRAHGLRVLVVEDTPEPRTPDAVFPNNWISLHADGRVVLYPMCAPNRRLERRPDLLAALAREFEVGEVQDWSGAEQRGQFLEGTGSLIFDHPHRLAYASLSERTHARLVAEVCAALGYQPVIFRATDAQGAPIYHTNVMMSVGTQYAVVCLESIRDAQERRALTEALARTGHALIDISLAQVRAFAGNLLEVRAMHGAPLLVLSRSAYAAFAPEQRAQLAACATLVPLTIPTIEAIGGGSARCMLAEVFLPARRVQEIPVGFPEIVG